MKTLQWQVRSHFLEREDIVLVLAIHAQPNEHV